MASLWAAKRLSPSYAKLNVSNLLVYGAGLIVLFIVISALFPGQIAPYSPTEMVMTDIMLPPSFSMYSAPTIMAATCSALSCTAAAIHFDRSGFGFGRRCDWRRDRRIVRLSGGDIGYGFHGFY